MIHCIKQDYYTLVIYTVSYFCNLFSEKKASLTRSFGLSVLLCLSMTYQGDLFHFYYKLSADVFLCSHHIYAVPGRTKTLFRKKTDPKRQNHNALFSYNLLQSGINPPSLKRPYGNSWGEDRSVFAHAGALDPSVL